MGRLSQTLPFLAALALLLLFVGPSAARRVRVRPTHQRPVDEDDSASAPDQDTNPQHLRYYAAQPADDGHDTQQAGVVLVSSDAYNGLYGRPTARAQTDVSEAQLRSALASSRAISTAGTRPRVKETSKQPPVQTIRNYSKVNDDGSFTFGYEAADGSFKEETRGTDCVVRGKYGYIDPDGNKREFTYVSGNPCDPNSVQEEEEEEQDAPDSGEENIPKGPLRPLRPLRPTTPASVAPRPTTTVFEQNYQQDEDALDDAPQQLFTPTPRTRFLQPTPGPSVYQTHTLESATRSPAAVRITPRPPTPAPLPAVASATTPRSQLPATTYRPQLLQFGVTPRPTPLYTKQPLPRPTATATPFAPTPTQSIDFDEELRKFQIENNVLTTPSPVRAQVPQIHQQSARQPLVAQQVRPRPIQTQTLPQQQRKAPSGDPVYTTELVYDPSTGQYNTVLYQQLPQTTGELNLRHRLQPYVQTSPLQHQYYQQQQAALLAQSQQLYAQQQQQRAVAQQQQQQQQQQQRYLQQLSAQTTTRAPPRYSASAAAASPQAQFYYVTPSAGTTQRDQLAQGQIEAFLRGHNIAF